MSKPTPGPWTTESPDGSQWGVYDAQQNMVAQAQQVRPLPHDIRQEERSANARLLAAAPELLDALKKCAAVCAGETVHKNGLIDALEAARAAIAKATGN